MLMGRKQRTFITQQLIPFILRERGRGFAMDRWRLDGIEGENVEIDDVARIAPSCGTIACIGGSVEVLLKTGSGRKIRQALGLTPQQATSLFYGWMCDDDYPLGSWPRRFQARYEKATTTLGKARAAAALLREVIHTRGACLNPPERART